MDYFIVNKDDKEATKEKNINYIIVYMSQNCDEDTNNVCLEKGSDQLLCTEGM